MGDNAKSAVGCEMLVRCYVGAGGEFEDLKGFREIVGKGVAVRLKGAKVRGRGRGGGSERVEEEWRAIECFRGLCCC